MLQSTRLQFAGLTAADAPFILELVNEPGWLRHIGDRNVHDLAAAEDYIRKGAAKAPDGFGLDRVSRIDTGEVIGLCGLLQRDYLDAPDIGYAFLQRHGGSGYASEAAATVLAQAAARGLRRLYALTSADNEASIRVLQKSGFRFERWLQTPGSEQASRLFVLAIA